MASNLPVEVLLTKDSKRKKAEEYPAVEHELCPI